MESSARQYYSIREVADLFQINASKLRYYEKEFPMLQPKKNRAGDRIYTQADIKLLTDILDLVDRQKFTISGAREYLQNRDLRRRENARFVAKLRELKAFLQQVRETLD